MATIEISKPSPRIEENILKWYVGNTFALNWRITLYDGENPIVYSATDTLTWSFYQRGNLVETITFTNIPNTNVCTLLFDATRTAKFGVGKYTYCIAYNGTYLTTVGANGEIEVERCH